MLLNDLRLYLRLIGIQIRSQLQYKANLLVDIVTYFCVTGLEFLTLFLYFAQFPVMGGWHVGEVALLYSVTSIGFGLAELFGAGIDSFDEIIRRGDFDRVLLRPVTALVQVASNEFRLRRLGRITQGILSSWLALFLLPGLRWTALKALVLMFGFISSAIIFDAVLLLGATICFWTVETTELSNILYYGGREMLSYPITIYHQLLQRLLLFVVPLAFGSYLPVCYLLDRPLPFGFSPSVALLSPLVALAFGAVSLWIWGYGVRHYQSTGN